MNNLRFRAWHKELKVMRPVNGLSGLMGKSRVEVFVPKYLDESCMFFRENEYWPIEDIELMQWTGCYDSHTKEIYENDIICRGGYASVIQGIVRYCDSRGAYIVEHDNIDNEDPYLLEEFLDTNGLVLDNIYQNPELLEVIK